MSHQITERGAAESLDYFDRLSQIVLAPDLDVASKLERLFAVETDEFGLDYGFLTRIDREEGTQHFEVVYPDAWTVSAGKSVPLSVTYCRKTIDAPDGTMAISDAGTEGWEGDPAYERFGFESYLGTTVSAEGGLYGTLCFASEEPRSPPISAQEATLVRMHGRWVTFELNQWTGPRTGNFDREDLEGLDVSTPSGLDSMMETLSSEGRRFVLLWLLDDSDELHLDDLGGATDPKGIRSQLHHVHLPKLDEAGYVEWDREADVVSRGPMFEEIEPVLRVLER